MAVCLIACMHMENGEKCVHSILCINEHSKGWCYEFDGNVWGPRAPHVEFSNILHKIYQEVKVSNDQFWPNERLKPLLFGIFYAKYSKTQHEWP